MIEASQQPVELIHSTGEILYSSFYFLLRSCRFLEQETAGFYSFVGIFMKQALPQKCHLQDLCVEKKMCSPEIRICERTPESEPIFAFIDSQLNEPANPLHDRAACSFNWETVPKETTVLDRLRSQLQLLNR